MNKIGLVLSGGGIRGIAHLGLLKAMDEIGVKPSAISGVSAGAIIGAMYASGISPDEILKIGKSQINFGFSNLLLRRGGLFSREFIHKILVEHLPHNSFEGLKIPLIVNATDFTRVESVYFSKGELIPCLEASASVPILFSPANFEERMLVDGGLLNNFPVEPLIGMCDKLIGSHVNKLKEHDQAGRGTIAHGYPGKMLSHFHFNVSLFKSTLLRSVYRTCPGWIRNAGYQKRRCHF